MTERRTGFLIGVDANHRVRAHGSRRVLVVADPTAAGTGLTDVLPLLEADHRISVRFTVAPGAGATVRRGTEESLRSLACRVLSWQEALRYDFDLVLAAYPRGLAELRGPALLLPEDEDVPCLRGTRALPQVVALPHDSALDVLARACPAAASRADVVGDICYDRLLASIPFRARYREALGITRGQRLVVAAYRPDVVRRLTDELLPAHFPVAVTVPPHLWRAHGERQVRAWLGDHLDAGALLVPPGEGWRAALVAADLVIGGCEPLTLYGAALGLATMTTASGAGPRPHSPIGIVRQHAAPLRDDRPLADQVRAALAGDRSWQDRVAARLTSRSGWAGETLRGVLYRELGLREPARAVPCSPVPVSCPITGRARRR